MGRDDKLVDVSVGMISVIRLRSSQLKRVPSQRKILIPLVVPKIDGHIVGLPLHSWVVG